MRTIPPTDFEFTVTPNVGESINHIRINAARAGSAGPRVLVLRSSMDNYVVSHCVSHITNSVSNTTTQ